MNIEREEPKEVKQDNIPQFPPEDRTNSPADNQTKQPISPVPEDSSSIRNRKMSGARILRDMLIGSANMRGWDKIREKLNEIEDILDAAYAAGAREAGYVLLRLPLELKEIFREWLATEFPDRARRVLSLLQSMHGGKDYVAEFGMRQRGSGPYADQIAKRFRIAMKRLGYNAQRQELRCDLFQAPVLAGQQMALF